MKKLLSSLPLVLTITLISLTSNANDITPAKADAPQEYLSALIDMCRDYVKEDAVPKSEEKKYMLDCVNEDLEMDGYKLLKVLP